MPEKVSQKVRRSGTPPVVAAEGEGEGEGAYAELDVTTNYSFLRGASHPDELVFRAAELGYRAIGITDVNSLAGVVKAYDAAKQVEEQGGRPPKLVVGARLTLGDGPDVLVWAMDRGGYGRLCRLLTIGKRRAGKGDCALGVGDVVEHCEGLMGAVVVGEATERRSDEATEGKAKGETQREGGLTMDNCQLAIGLLREGMGERLSLAVSCDYGGDDRGRIERIARMGRRMGVPILATNQVHYHVPERRALQDVLVCIREGCAIQEAGFRLFPNGERYLKRPGEMRRLFEDWPGAIRRGLEIAERCQFKLDELRYEYPEVRHEGGENRHEGTEARRHEGGEEGSDEATKRRSDEGGENEPAPERKSAIEHLAELTWRGAAGRYPGGVPEKVRKLIQHELVLIERLKYEAYFLTVHDLVVFARSRGILCQGRGSAANSAVCYCLGITSVDPERIDVLFERFVSAARGEPPDIDVDFEHERREEVIQYIYEKYGRERAGMTGVVITYRGRSAVRDVGKAMGLSLDLVEKMAGKLDGWTRGTLREEEIRELGLDAGDATVRRVVELTGEILGFPRHLSQHVGGMVMTRGALCELVPIENAAMEGRTVIEWDKDDIDALGILKVDVLALGMLTCISRALRFINGGFSTEHTEDTENTEGRQKRELATDLAQMNSDLGSGEICGPSVASPQATVALSGLGGVGGSDQGLAPLAMDRRPVGAEECGKVVGKAHPTGRSSLRRSVAPSLRRFPLELHTIPAEDPAVYEMIGHADTVGVFQIESRAQMSMLPRLKPRCFYDLVIEVAIVRPGPIQGNMVHPYLRRRNGEEAVSYPSEALRGVLEKTLGVPLFQEQAMRVAMVGAGFSAEEADKLRRAMAAWRKQGAIEQFHRKIVEGMVKNGYTREFAEQCFLQIRGFGEYGFPESHAASFALLVYASAWIKRYYPAAFCAALLNSQPMGFYAPAQIVRDAREHGVEVRAVDVNWSGWECGLEEIHRGGAERRNDECRMMKEESEGEERHSSISPAVRLGFRVVKGVREGEMGRIVEARRRGGRFSSVEEVQRRCGVGKSCLVRLAKADAFGSMGLTRRQALWRVMELSEEEAPLFEGVEERTKGKTQNAKREMEEVALPVMPIGQEVRGDYRVMGLSLKRHPVALVRGELEKRGIVRAEEVRGMEAGRWVRVAGLVLIRQRPGTAGGIVFETLEDETGVVNLIVRPNIYEKYRAAARGAGLLHAEGYVERQGEVVHVLVWRMYDVSGLLEGCAFASRDFH